MKQGIFDNDGFTEKIYMHVSVYKTICILHSTQLIGKSTDHKFDSLENKTPNLAKLLCTLCYIPYNIRLVYL